MSLTDYSFNYFQDEYDDDQIETIYGREFVDPVHKGEWIKYIVITTCQHKYEEYL